jgi:predicted nucleic-acid-binding protein
METARHLLFDCSHARNIWDNYNEIVIEDKVITYEDLIQVNDSQAAIMIKMKLIQELIQIERPKNWNKERIIGVIENLIEIERYNAIKNKNIHKFKKIWNKYEKLTMKKDGKLPDQT